MHPAWVTHTISYSSLHNVLDHQSVNFPTIGTMNREEVTLLKLLAVLTLISSCVDHSQCLIISHDHSGINYSC